MLLLLLLASCVLGQGEQQEKVKRGKEVRFSASGEVEVGLRFKKWSEPKQRFLCCPLAHKHCKSPCKGISCDATCTLSCGLFSMFTCAPISCAVANPLGCVDSTTCQAGWTASGSKCFRVW